MQRRSTAECDHRIVFDRFAEFHRVHARSIRHILGDNLRDRERAQRRIDFERLGDIAHDRGFRTCGLQCDPAAGKSLRIQQTHRAISIGHGRAVAATSVACRAGLGPGTIRADLHALEIIHARDGTAAGADLDHFDHRYANRQSAAFHKAVHAPEFEAARNLRLVIVNETYFGSGAAHVE